MATCRGAADLFVAGMADLQTYHDKVICHTSITGGGHRFHGFKRLMWSTAASVLKDHQRNAVFHHTTNGAMRLETMTMTDRNTCTGVVDPATLDQAPHNLVPVERATHAGAVSKRTFKWNTTVTDTLLHRVFEHPSVLDVWVEPGTVAVFIVHDRNIQGGLVDEITRHGKRRRCTRSLKSGACKASSRWKPRSRPPSTRRACG